MSANKIKFYRLTQGLQLKVLAADTGLSQGHLSHLENGDKQPSKATMESIAKALNRTVPEVFYNDYTAEESGYGRYTFRKNNIFGYGTKDFDSVPQCIDYVACKLRDNYLTPGGIYYEGCSVEQIGIHYNGRSTWVANVRQIMYEIVERIDTQ